MISQVVCYAGQSDTRKEGGGTVLAVRSEKDRPVRFRGRLREGALSLRLALQAFAAVLQSNARGEAWWHIPGQPLDPLLTVHPDVLCLEALSQDRGVLAVLTIDRGLFETEGEVVEGTTPVDFSGGLVGGIGTLRSGIPAWLEVGPGEGEVVRRQLDLSEEWLRGLVQVQEAMTFPGTRQAVRPVDLLIAIRYLRCTRTRLSPRALRYEFEPSGEARLVLEPWEKVIVLKGTQHSYTDRYVVRTWGRRRLELVDPLLPYADCVDVYLKGRSLPSYYVVRLPGVTFLLALSGWADQGWDTGAGFDLLTRRREGDEALLEPARAYLAEARRASVDDLAAALGVDWEAAQRLLLRLCRRGLVMVELESRLYRYRPLLREPLDEALVFAPNRRQRRARQLVGEGAVSVIGSAAQEWRKLRRLPTPEGPVVREVVRHNWRITGRVGKQAEVEVVLGETGRIIFGRCGCAFFGENILNKGPCEHLLALAEVGAATRPEPAANEVPAAP